MKGYIKNITNEWLYALKRSIGPGEKIELDSLYLQYGPKYDMPPGEEFVKWLKDIKLKNLRTWSIVYEPQSDESVVVATVAAETTKSNKVNNNNRFQAMKGDDYTSAVIKKETDISDIVEMSVRHARIALPKIKDIKLLKYSLKQAEQLSGKDSLCMVIRKRIKELGG